MADDDPPAPRPLRRLAEEMVAAGDCSAVSLCVASARGALANATAGRRRLRESGAVGPASRFDLASLTKPLIGELARSLDDAGELALTCEVGELWSDADPRLARRSLASLLEHRAGMQPWTPLYLRCTDRREVARLLVGGTLLGASPGTYSDLDFVLWGLTAERELGQPLASLVADRLEPELGAPLLPGPDAVECGLDNGREVELAAAQGWTVAPRPGPPPGTVQDGNARFLGGVAGHAGLFAAAATVARLARRALRRAGEARGASEGGYGLGWARPETWEGGGGELDAGSFGHLGFTGGSVWADPSRDRIAVLLAHRTASGLDLDPWRRRFHRLAFADPETW